MRANSLLEWGRSARWVPLYICTFVHLYISSLPCREVPSSRTLCYGRIPLLLRKLLSYNRCRFCTALHKKTNFGYSFFIFKDRKNCGSVFFIFKDGKNFLNGFSFCFYEIPPQFRIILYGTVFSVQFFSKLGRPKLDRPKNKLRILKKSALLL